MLAVSGCCCSRSSISPELDAINTFKRVLQQTNKGHATRLFHVRRNNLLPVLMVSHSSIGTWGENTSKRKCRGSQRVTQGLQLQCVRSCSPRAPRGHQVGHTCVVLAFAATFDFKFLACELWNWIGPSFNADLRVLCSLYYWFLCVVCLFSGLDFRVFRFDLS